MEDGLEVLRGQIVLLRALPLHLGHRGGLKAIDLPLEGQELPPQQPLYRLERLGG